MINEPATMEALRRVINGDIPVAKAKNAENVGVTSFEGRTGEVGLTDLDFGKVFDIGDLWFTTGSATPAARFGGTWAKLTDCFLYAASSVPTPGAMYGSHTRVLTISQLPAHTHRVTPEGTIGGGGSWWMNNVYIPAGTGVPGCGGVMQKQGNYGVSYGSTQYSGASSLQGYAITGFMTREHTHTFTGTESTTSQAGASEAVDVKPRHTYIYVWRKIA